MYHFLSSQVYSSMFIINVCIYIYILYLYVSCCFFMYLYVSLLVSMTHTHEDINRLTHVPQATQINFANELGPVDIQPFWNDHPIRLPSVSSTILVQPFPPWILSPPFQVLLTHQKRFKMKWNEATCLPFFHQRFLWSPTINITSISGDVWCRSTRARPIYQRGSSPNHVRKLMTSAKAAAELPPWMIQWSNDPASFRPNLWPKNYRVSSKCAGTFTNFMVPWGQGFP